MTNKEDTVVFTQKVSTIGELYKITGRPKTNWSDGIFGVEIETETKTPYEPPRMTFWNTHGDGSLRDFGVEWVLKRPLSGSALKAALDEFGARTKDLKFIPDSISTSVHVHINALNMTLNHAAGFVSAYTLSENLLIRYCGESRLSNLFCLPICDSEVQLSYLKAFITGLAEKQPAHWNFSEDRSKYSALNFGSLPKFGSLEVRSMRGLTNPNEVGDWVHILEDLYNSTMNNNFNAKELLKIYLDKGPIDTIKLIYPNTHKRLLSTQSNRSHSDLIQKNLWYLASIGSTISDKQWDILAQGPRTVKLPKAELEKILSHKSSEVFGLPYQKLTASQRILIDETIQRDLELGLDSKKGSKFKRLEIYEEPDITIPEPSDRETVRTGVVNWNPMVIPNPSGRR